MFYLVTVNGKHCFCFPTMAETLKFIEDAEDFGAKHIAINRVKEKPKRALDGALLAKSIFDDDV